MLDAIIKLAAERLGFNMREVREARAKLHEELSGGEGRYAATTQLIHPRGSSTPLTEAADRAQQAYDRAREKVTKELPKTVALILAQQVAQELRDETAAARDRFWNAGQDRLMSGVHPETRDLFARLFEHGVTPWQLKALSNEDVAIIADLIRWKAHDPRYKVADTPWRLVLAIYAGRLILKPSSGTKVVRSVAGSPMPPVRYTDPHHYMFNEMVDPAWGGTALPTGKADLPSPETIEPLAAGSDDADAHRALADPGDGAVNDDAPQEVAAPKVPKISEAQARTMAEAIFERNPIWSGMYWPDEGVEQYDYNPDQLIPALERYVASGSAWSGSREFLEAARAGKAREFIADRRQDKVRRLTADLMRREEHAIEMARDAGFEV